MQNKKLLTLATLVAATLSNSASAFDDRLYIAPTVSYLWLDDERQTTRDGYGFGLGLGKAINENVNLEIKGFYNNYDDNNQWDTFGAIADIQYYFSRKKLAPYVVAGAGVMDSNVHGGNAFGLLGEAGAGLAYKLNANFSLRGDVRYRYNNNFNDHITPNTRDEYSDMVINLGFTIPLGRNQKKNMSDTDTSHSSSDLDNDGVRNAYDKCPNTRPNIEVNEVGCDFNISLVGVNFAINSDRLTQDAKELLDQVAKDLNSYPKKKDIEIQGHTSRDGSSEANMILSQKRAQAVVNYLLNKGVSNKMTAKGYGEEKPLDKKSTKGGELKNRRVELIWK